jgi:hypothetical protein
MNDPELILRVMLVGAAALIILSAGLVALSISLLVKAHKYLAELRRGPSVARWPDGRRLYERL